MIEVTGPIMSPPEGSFWVMGVGCDGVLEVKGTKFPSGFVFEPILLQSVRITTS